MNWIFYPYTSKAVLKIQGGTFTCGDYSLISSNSEASPTITGGTFDVDPSAYVSGDGVGTTKTAGDTSTTYTVATGNVAQLLDTDGSPIAAYMDLSTALSNVETTMYGETTGTQTVKLLNNIDLGTSGAGSSATDSIRVNLDLNGYTITSNVTSQTGGVLNLTKSDNFTISDSKGTGGITNTNASYNSIAISAYVDGNSNLTINGGTFTSSGTGYFSSVVYVRSVSTTGGYSNVYINGGTFKATGTAFNIGMYGKLNVTDCTVEAAGDSNFGMVFYAWNAASFNASGGVYKDFNTLVGLSTSFKGSSEISSGSFEGSSLFSVIADDVTGTVSVSGGTYSVTNIWNSGASNRKTASVFPVTGGKFRVELTGDSLVSSGYEEVINSDGTYVVHQTNGTYELSYYKDGDTPIYPLGVYSSESSTYSTVFAGWYLDSSYGTVNKETSGAAHAKFAPVMYDSTSAIDGVIEYLGGSLRMADTDSDYSTVSMRLGYDLHLPSGCTWVDNTGSETAGDGAYGWTYGLASNCTYKVNGKAYTINSNGSYKANIVFTGITSDRYSVEYAAQMWITYITADGTTVKVTETQTDSNSVSYVCGKISEESSSATQTEKDFVTALKKAWNITV